MNKLSDWYSGLQAREQRMVLIGAVLVMPTSLLTAPLGVRARTSLRGAPGNGSRSKKS